MSPLCRECLPSCSLLLLLAFQAQPVHTSSLVQELPAAAGLPKYDANLKNLSDIAVKGVQQSPLQTRAAEITSTLRQLALSVWACLLTRPWLRQWDEIRQTELMRRKLNSRTSCSLLNSAFVKLAMGV